METYNLRTVDELIGLERVLKNYVKLRRAEALVAKEGQTITRFTSEGREQVLAHPMLNWISQWENQLRSWMKEMRFTRKEKPQGQTQKIDMAKELETQWKKQQEKKKKK